MRIIRAYNRFGDVVSRMISAAPLGDLVADMPPPERIAKIAIEDCITRKSIIMDVPPNDAEFIRVGETFARGAAGRQPWEIIQALLEELQRQDLPTGSYIEMDAYRAREGRHVMDLIWFGHVEIK